MQASTGRKAALLAFVLCASLFVLPTVLGQATDINELKRDSTMQGEPTTPTGKVIGGLYVQIIWLSIAVFLLVGIVLVYILIRFRHRRGQKVDVPQIHGNSRLEIAWTIGPALVMIYLLVISYNGLLAIDIPEDEPEFTVNVTASRFTWAFEYPDGTTEASALSTLRVQEDTWVRLAVTSTDVIHAIAIPGLDVMIDANPGRINHVQFMAEEPGVYLVQCRQFCGTGHGEMLAAVAVFERGSQEVPYGKAPTGAPPTVPGQPGNETDNETEEPPADVDRTIEVRAFDFGFGPMPLDDVEPGERIQFVLINDSPATPHNLYFGTYDREAKRGEPVCADPNDPDTCWATTFTVRPGETDSFVFTAPEEPEAFDMWCAVGSHPELGMLSYVSVGGAEPEIADGTEPRLPGPGVAITLVGLLAAAVVFARRR